MRHVQAAVRALTWEMKLGLGDWPELIKMVQTILNETPVKRLRMREDGVYRSPLEVMTGILPSRYHLSLPQIESKTVECKSIETVRARQLTKLEALQGAIESMHIYVEQKVSKNHAKQIKHHSKKNTIFKPNCSFGDFVVVRKGQDMGHKLSFRWVGPRKITKIISDWYIKLLVSQQVMLKLCMPAACNYTGALLRLKRYPMI